MPPIETPYIPPQPTDIAATPSPNSNSLRLHYGQLAQAQRAEGKLAQAPTAGASASGTDVARIFKTLAFQDEFATTKRPLQRWKGSVSVRLIFGPSVEVTARTRITSQVDDVLAQITALTGLSTGRNSILGNFDIYVVNDGERRTIPASPANVFSGDPSAFEVGLIRNMRRSDQCMVMAYTNRQHTRHSAVAIIREELPPILQLACIQEEITQALGLTNDSPRADPSIFNDDDQYATLTGLDRRLLQLLYHPALRPGMTLETAGPIIDQITQPQRFASIQQGG
ncbi:MAG: DUF2927 domain-containing protein [Pseudomonadota bacterium]